MASNQDRLALEVERILAAPYLTSLQQLHLTLQECRASDIREWAAAAPEKVFPLAEAVIESLALWPYTSEIVLKLVESGDFRNATFHLDPCYLDDILRRAIDGPSLENVAAQIAIKMLSTPLPDTVILPAAAQTLLSSLFQKAVDEPVPANVETIYNVLHGACSDIPQVLDTNEVGRLSQTLKHIMRTVKHWKDQEVSFYCLIIMRKLKSPPDRESHVQVRDSFASLNLNSVAESRSNVQDAERYFNGPEATKLVELLTLHMIHTCNPSIPAESSTKVSTLCRKAVALVDMEIRNQWASQNRGHVEKLWDKLSKARQLRYLQLEGFAFVAILIGTHETLKRVAGPVQETLLDLLAFPSRYALDSDLLKEELTCYSMTFTKGFWQSLLSCMFEHISDTRLRSSGTVLKNLQRWLDAIENLAHHCPLLRSAATEKLMMSCTAAFLSKMTKRSYLSGGTASFSAQVALDSQFASFLLSFLLSAMQIDKACPKREVYDLILQWQHSLLRLSLEHRTPRPRITRPRPRSSASDIEIKDGCSRNWRSILANSLDEKSPEFSNRIINLFGQLCRDLEKRCELIEEPLKVAENKSEVLMERLAALVIEKESLDEELKVLSLALSEAKECTRQSEDDCLTAANEIRELTTIISQLEETIKQNDEKHDRALQETTSRHHETEMELRGRIAAGAEAQESQIEKIEKLQQSVSDSELKSQSLRQELELSQKELEDARALWQSERDQHTESAGQLEIVTSELNKAKVSIQELQEHVRLKDAEQNGIIDSHSSQIEIMVQEKDALRKQLDESVAKLENELQNLRTSAKEQSKKYQRELDCNTRTLSEARESLDCKRRELEQKDIELSEAQELKQRLLRAMGLSQADTASKSQSRQVSKGSGATKFSSVTIPTENYEIQTNLLDVGDGWDSFESSNSSNQSGPTPKRMKPRQEQRNSGRDHAISMSLRKPMETLQSNEVSRTNERLLNPKPQLSETFSSPVSEKGIGIAPRDSSNEYSLGQENAEYRASSDQYGRMGSFDFDGSLTEL